MQFDILVFVNINNQFITTGSDETVLCKMSINTIINGGATPEGADFIGLIPLINQYMASIKDIDAEQRSTLNGYLKLISDRAAGM